MIPRGPLQPWGAKSRGARGLGWPLSLQLGILGSHTEAVEQGGCRMEQSPPGEAAQLSKEVPLGRACLRTHGMQTVPSSCVTAATAQPWQKHCCALVLLLAGCCTSL